MEETFKRSFASLEKMFEFIDRFTSTHDLDDDAKFSISFVLEELFTNMVKYNADATTDIAIGLTRKDNTVTMVIIDRSTNAFDLTKRKPVDTTMELSERQAGGLGIHLVKQMADNVEYRFDNGVNTITVTKHVKGSHV